jgi:hypothetical protein
VERFTKERHDREEPAVGGLAQVVRSIGIRYANRDPLRFASHRDFALALERAVRRTAPSLTPRASLRTRGSGTRAPRRLAWLLKGVPADRPASAVDPASCAALDAALAAGWTCWTPSSPTRHRPGGPDRRLALAAVVPGDRAGGRSGGGRRVPRSDEVSAPQVAEVCRPALPSASSSTMASPFDECVQRQGGCVGLHRLAAAHDDRHGVGGGATATAPRSPRSAGSNRSVPCLF